MSDAAGVALVGFMGCGKTAVGRAVARRLGVPFEDVDALVERRAGRPVADLFAEQGEAAFRALEREEAVAALARAAAAPAVVALGGGAVQHDDVRAALARVAHVVHLTAPPEVLWRRVCVAGRGSRPLAADRERFFALYEARRPLYEAVATATVANDGSRPLAAVAAEVAALAAAGGRP